MILSLHFLHFILHTHYFMLLVCLINASDLLYFRSEVASFMELFLDFGKRLAHDLLDLNCSKE